MQTVTTTQTLFQTQTEATNYIVDCLKFSINDKTTKKDLSEKFDTLVSETVESVTPVSYKECVYFFAKNLFMLNDNIEGLEFKEATDLIRFLITRQIETYLTENKETILNSIN